MYFWSETDILHLDFLRKIKLVSKGVNSLRIFRAKKVEFATPGVVEPSLSLLLNDMDIV